MELEREILVAARDLASINSWIFDQHNCRERGTIVVPSEYWDRADEDAKEILINVARIENWHYRIELSVTHPALELAGTT